MQKSPAARVAVLGVINLGIALGNATLLRLHFLVSSTFDSNPPQCFNHYGDRVDCDLDGSSASIYLALIAAIFVLLGLLEYAAQANWNARSANAHE